MSNAMVLCASLEPTVELVDVPPGVPVGSRVVVRWDAGVALPPPELEVNPSRKNNPWSTCQPHLMVDEQGLLVLKDARGPGLHEPLFARWGLGEGVRVCVEVGWEVPSTNLPCSHVRLRGTVAACCRFSDGSGGESAPLFAATLRNAPVG